ncbi:hypothetical protein Pyn_18288 [Prunus yedoensis var. nudiflora]|uniref:Uncharacterized protein n=1 Tax=Prunus yedoensis var. nudiflora TaxID=2094558 RepID=A0A314UYV6_PRUYE|nr:hypothetical protein Pyn_18288 [Prunus yedoensis var. nudiflora]
MHNKERIDQTQLNWMMLLASNTGKGREAAVMTAMVVATTMAVLCGGKDDQLSRRGCGRCGNHDSCMRSVMVETTMTPLVLAVR